MSRKTKAPVFESVEPRSLLSATVDLRLPGGGKTANVTSVGQTVNVEIWAMIKGANGSASDEGLQSLIGSLLSTKGGLKGNLSAKLASPFNASASSVGKMVDLDGDGDLDIGSNTPNSAANHFAIRANLMQKSGAGLTGGQEFLVGTVMFTVTSLVGGSTQLNFRPRNYSIQGLYTEDGKTVMGSFAAGSAVTIRSAASPAPLPSQSGMHHASGGGFTHSFFSQTPIV